MEMKCDKRISRRKALSIAAKVGIGAVVGAAVGGIAGYLFGQQVSPKVTTQVSTVTHIQTITAGEVTKTVTTTLPGQTVTTTVTRTTEEVAPPSLKGVPKLPFKEIVIADLFPLTGGMAQLGIADHLGVKAAVEYINEAGGFGGAKIKLVSGDAKSDPTAAVSEAERLITQYQPSILIGCYASSLSLPVSDVTEKYKIPFITHSVADAITERGYKYVFRTTPKGTHQGEVNVRGALEFFRARGWEPKTAMVVYEDSPSPKSLAEGYKKILKENNIDIVYEEAYPPGIKDVTDIATRIMRANGDILCINAYMAEAVLFWKALRGMGFRGKPILTAGYITPEFGDILGWDKVAGTMYAATWIHSAYVDGACTLINELYLRKARAEGYNWKFIHEAAGNYFATVYLAAYATTLAESNDPKDIRDALSRIYVNARDKSNPFWLAGASSANGLVKFDDTGQNIISEDAVGQWISEDPWIVTTWPFYMETPGGKVMWPIP